MACVRLGACEVMDSKEIAKRKRRHTKQMREKEGGEKSAEEEEDESKEVLFSIIAWSLRTRPVF